MKDKLTLEDIKTHVICMIYSDFKIQTHAFSIINTKKINNY